MHTSSHHSRSHTAFIAALTLLGASLAIPAAARDAGDVHIEISKENRYRSADHHGEKVHAYAEHGSDSWSEGREYAQAHHTGKRYDDRRRHDHRYDRRYDRRYDDRRYDRHRDERRYYRDRRRDERRRHRHNHRRYENRRSHRGYDGYYGDRPWSGSDYNSGYYVRYGRYSGRHFDIPKVIISGRGHYHGDHYYGNDYYRPHNHYHEVYIFPTYYGDRVEYRPHVYCEGKLYARAHFDFRGGLEIDFEFSF